MKPEEALQVAVVEFLRLAMPASEGIVFHPANGGLRSKATAGRLKAMGVLAGVPDLCFVLKGGRVGFIELKAGKNDTSDGQDWFGDVVRDLGGEWAEARSIDDVAAALRSWGVKLRGSVGVAA